MTLTRDNTGTSVQARARYVRGRITPQVGRLPEASFALAAGVLLVSLAYTGSRHGGGWWVGSAFWLGQAAIFVPVAVRMFARGLGVSREAFGLVLGMTTAAYLIKCLYAPFRLEFPDELQHWRTAENILASGHLFDANYALPISPLYPALEVVTSAAVTVTGLPLVPVALIVAGIAHLVFVAGLYLLFQQLSGSVRVAGLAVLVYATNAHFQFFDAMYAYQTMALVFFALTLHAVARLTTGSERTEARTWWALAVVAIAGTVITHHLTSYLLTASLLLFAFLIAFTRETRGRLGAALLAAISAFLVGVWLVLVAPATLGYLKPAVGNLLDGIAQALGGTPHSSALGTATPLADRMLGYAFTLVIALALPMGWYHVWQTQRSRPWALAMLVGSAGFYAALGVRVLIPEGTELAGRFFTFVYVPVAYVLAVGATRMLIGGIRWRARWISGVTLATVLFLGGLATGWPPYWERLPGTFHVDGFESGVSAEGIAAATWTREELGPGNRIGGDFTSYVLLGTYGDQDVARRVAQLYYAPDFRPADRRFVARASVHYLMIDHRVAEQLPVTGAYFPADPKADQYRHPIAEEALQKFDRVRGVDRVYDGGAITIYNLRGSRYAP